MVGEPEQLISVFDLLIKDRARDLTLGIIENIPQFVKQLKDKETFM
jgi:hypothetical protein